MLDPALRELLGPEDARYVENAITLVDAGVVDGATAAFVRCIRLMDLASKLNPVEDLLSVEELRDDYFPNAEITDAEILAWRKDALIDFENANDEGRHEFMQGHAGQWLKDLVDAESTTKAITRELP
jgi:hypothetical protein